MEWRETRGWQPKGHQMGGSGSKRQKLMLLLLIFFLVVIAIIVQKGAGMYARI